MATSEGDEAGEGSRGGSLRPEHDVADLTEDDDDDPNRDRGMKLVGGEGGDFVARALSTADDVADAIRRVQDQGALSTTESESTEPLLGLLGQLGMTRAESYEAMLDDALALLRARIESMSQGKLLTLLDESFPYIGIEELKAIPLAALERLKPVPSSYLKQISRDADLFRQLPPDVQRQCWELRPALLRRHAAPVLVAYSEETATTMRNLDSDLVLTPLNAEEEWGLYPPGQAPAEGPSAPRAAPGLPRRSLRRASASVARLKKIVGDSQTLYLGIVSLCRAQYAEHGSPAACSLRSQFLMALHDEEQTDLCASDRCHRLAWLADACARDRCVDGRRLTEILQLVETAVFDASAGERAAATERKKKAAAAKKAEAAAKKAAAAAAAAAERKERAAAARVKPKMKVQFTFGKKPPAAAVADGDEPAVEEDGEREKPATVADADADAASKPPDDAPVPAAMDVADGEEDAPTPTPTPGPALAAVSVGGNNTAVGDDDDDGNGGGESDAPAGSISRVNDIGGASDENLLGDLGMVLRDPPVLNLLLHEIVRTLETLARGVGTKGKASGNRLGGLTRLVAIALGARRVLRESKPRREPTMPAAPKEATEEFYPLLRSMLEESIARAAAGEGDEDDAVARAREEKEDGEAEEGELNRSDYVEEKIEHVGEDGEITIETRLVPKAKGLTFKMMSPAAARHARLVSLISEGDLMRKVALTYALRRLHHGDVRAARPVLRAIANGGASDASVLDEAAAAVTLARRLAALNSGVRAVAAAAPGTSCWKHAVDGFLLRACVASMETHEEVLRLILAVTDRPTMTDDVLAGLVETTLHATRKSRRTHKRRAKQIVYEYEPLQPLQRGVVAGRLGLGLGGGLLHGGGAGGAFHGGSGTDTGYASAGVGGGTSAADSDTDRPGSPGFGGGVDGVRATYQLLAQQASGRLTEERAPKLHEYLARRDRRDMRRAGGADRPFSPDGTDSRPFSP